MKLLNSVNSLILLFMIQTTFADSSIVEHNFNFRIKTGNIDGVFQKVIKVAEEKGGYFTSFNEHSLSIRFPTSNLPEFQQILESLAEIEEKGFESKDKSSDIERINSQIQSRKKLMETYFHLVKNASLMELQSVEREMVTLNMQIERLQGQKLAIEKRAELASIRISATYTPPVRPTANRYSPFIWINSTNLDLLQGDF